MVKNKVSGRAFPLSQEYIIDSDSDVRTEATSKSPKKGGKSPSQATTTPVVQPKRAKASLGPSTNPAPQTQSSSKNASTKDTPTSQKGYSTRPRLEREQGSLMSGKSQEMATASTRHFTSPTLTARHSRIPPDFHRATPSSSSSGIESPEDSRCSSRSDQVNSDQANKEVWHITAPASVPFSSIRGLGVDAVLSGDPVLTHDERQYRLLREVNHSKHMLLLPSDDGSTYTCAKEPISKSYCLRKLPHAPRMLSSGSVESTEAIPFAATVQPPSRKPPEQPAVLKMRYRAFGTNDESTRALTTMSTHPVFEDSKPRDHAQPSSSVPRSNKKKKSKRVDRADKQGISHPPRLDDVRSQTLELQGSNSQEHSSPSTLSIRRDSTAVGLASSSKKKRKAISEGSSSRHHMA